MPNAARSPVSGEAGAELQRLVERWRQLPLDRAMSYSGRVRALTQSLADRVAEASGVAASVVPDLGPATSMDQLTVMVYDTSALAVTPKPASSTAAERTPVGRTAAERPAAEETPAERTPAAGASTAATGLAADLAALRRELV